MTRKTITGILLAALVLLGFARWNLYGASRVHFPIAIDDVETVEVWGTALHGIRTIVVGEEINKIAAWFNSIDNVRANPDFQGTTPESGIVIRLKSREEILIFNSGPNFEVQRRNQRGRTISYWGKQTEIEKLLNDAM